MYGCESYLLGSLKFSVNSMYSAFANPYESVVWLNISIVSLIETTRLPVVTRFVH